MPRGGHGSSPSRTIRGTSCTSGSTARGGRTGDARAGRPRSTVPEHRADGRVLLLDAGLPTGDVPALAARPVRFGPVEIRVDLGHRIVAPVAHLPDRLVELRVAHRAVPQEPVLLGRPPLALQRAHGVHGQYLPFSRS